nr:PREDICTED: Fanconi anemia group D2 protein homolog isoform X1 [Nicotiana tabacum]
MVLLQNNQTASRKRPAVKSKTGFVPPFAPPAKIPKSAEENVPQIASESEAPKLGKSQTVSSTEKMISVLADAGCTLINPSGPPCLPSDLHKLRNSLSRLFSSDSSLKSEFVQGFSSYINSPGNLRRIISPSRRDGLGSVRSDSLTRVLLLVPSIQSDIQNLLLEKLPEYFDVDPGGNVGGRSSSLCLEEDIARLILNQFRWLDFLVDSEIFTEKLFQVLSICPVHLKKEIIGSLPEIIGEKNNKTVVDSLQEMLQEDSSIIVPMLDCFSNLHLDDMLQEQVITVALSCIRTIDVEHMPYLLRFLLLLATPANTRRIISHIRQQLKLVGASNVWTTQQSKMKGKSIVNNAEASILDALRTSLRFNKVICQETLNELKSLENVQNHKVIDIWLLMLIYMNSEPLQKSVEKLLKKKILEGCIVETMFDQCVSGNKDLAQDYLPTLLSITEYLLACKEAKAREFGIHMYTYLFKELVDSYSRQEVLGALITHVGSGISHEVSSALDVLVLLASKYSQELIPLSSHITGILDYLETFSVENLHKVYEAFSLLAFSAQVSTASFGSPISNELLVIVRKQLSSPDLIYKKMGLIGTLKIVSYLGDAKATKQLSSSQKSNYEEALELLETSMNSCKQLPLPLVMFYDELALTLKKKALHPAIVEWTSKHVGDFESKFLCDLDGGELMVKELYCGLEGDLWMNLDGDISPICLNILPLVSSSLRAASSLQILPANFVLLSSTERLANQGSLAGIDALLGCPIHLPSSKFFSQPLWGSLSGKQKQIIILSLYYAANWLRELLNAFCTQAVNECDAFSQATREEITLKLFKRLRNLVFLESLLNSSLRQCSFSLPELQPHLESLSLNQLDHNRVQEIKNEHGNGNGGLSQKKKKEKKTSQAPLTDGKLRQPTIMDVLRKSGAVPSQEPSVSPSGTCSKGSVPESSGNQPRNSNVLANIDVSTTVEHVEAQRYKFRPLLLECFAILAFQKTQDSCCADPASELPLCLYILRDLNRKLDYFSPRRHILVRRMSVPPAFGEMKVIEFISKIQPLFPSLRRHLDSAVSGVGADTEICPDHWKTHSAFAGNPDIPNITIIRPSVSRFVIKETLQCFGKMLNIPDVQRDKSVLSDLLEAFQPISMTDCFFQGMQLIPSPGDIGYLFAGAYSFVGTIFDSARAVSFALASEVLLSLVSVLASIRTILDNDLDDIGKDIRTGFSKELLSFLSKKLGTFAYTLLMQKCDGVNDIEDGQKVKAEVIQKLLRIYLENCESTSDSLSELACSVLPQVSSRKSAVEDGSCFPTLCPATFCIWYRVMHEENLAMINRLVKEISLLEKARGGVEMEDVKCLLKKLQQSVNVVVSLVNMCKTHDKVNVRAIAVKFGGKFVDSFLKAFDFLQGQFELQREHIIQMVRELQMATRTIQTLCSEAKGMKQTTITSKIPITKRSMERFLFRVKELLHSTSSGCTFWMGNLKHKNLMGDVVSSQAYIDDQNDNMDNVSMEDMVIDEPTDIAGE